VRVYAAASVRVPPFGDRSYEIVPKTGGKVRYGEANTISVGRRGLTPFNRSKIETETSRVPDWNARSAQIAAHICSGLPCRVFVEKLRGA